MKVGSMHTLVQKIRDLINQPWKQTILLKNPKYWNQLCSCLDAIEDSELAISGYMKIDPKTKEDALYLALYGLLQAFFLQQDAAMNLCEALHIQDSWENYPKLSEIRNIRNETVGHPTKKDRPKDQPVSFHHISRPTLTHKGFQLISTYADGTLPQIKDISTYDLMAAQKTYISEVLKKIIKSLESEWDKHKEKFRMDKLISCFPQTLGYPIKKLYERISNKDLASLGKIEISEIRKAPKCFLEALSRRGLDLEPYRYTTGPIEHALDRLEHFFEYAQTGEDCVLNEEDARIFAFFVEKKIRELKEIAQEIDEQYSD